LGRRHSPGGAVSIHDSGLNTRRRLDIVAGIVSRGMSDSVIAKILGSNFSEFLIVFGRSGR